MLTVLRAQDGKQGGVGDAGCQCDAVVSLEPVCGVVAGRAEEGCHQAQGAPPHSSVWCSGFPVSGAGLAQCVVPTAFHHACFCQLFSMAGAGEECSAPAGWAWSPPVAREQWCGLGLCSCRAEWNRDVQCVCVCACVCVCVSLCVCLCRAE